MNPYQPPKSETELNGNIDFTGKSRLPPPLVIACSVIFSCFTLTPLLLLYSHFCAEVGTPAKPASVQFLAFNFNLNRDPRVMVYTLGSLMILGGVVGLAILFRLWFAYGLASVYAAVTITVAILLHCFVEAGSVNWPNGMLQYLLLAWFCRHAFTERDNWRRQCACR